MKNTTADKNIMTAVFNSSGGAEQAYQELSNRGYKYNEISVLMSEDTCGRFRNNKSAEKRVDDEVGEAIESAAAEDATPSAIIVAIVALGVSIILPGSALIVTGPLAAALIMENGLSYGLKGALIGSGISGEAARLYERGIRMGGIFLSFKPRNTGEIIEIENIWKACKGDLILSF